jgi:hypothetical protein
VTLNQEEPDHDRERLTALHDHGSSGGRAAAKAERVWVRVRS